MYNPYAERAIFQSGMLNVVRRTLFTSISDEPGATAFELQNFYQQGTCVIARSRGTIYMITPSHVLRNATHNDYYNDSPFWAWAHRDQPVNVKDFLMPWRLHDFAPNGMSSLDAAVVEVNPFVLRLQDYIDWDKQSDFVNDDAFLKEATAVVAGYPEHENPYDFIDMPDGSVQQMAKVAVAHFTGRVVVDQESTWFENQTRRPGYAYAGLSGGVVVCAVREVPKYLGIVISTDGEGRRFKILRFSELRQAAGNFVELPWEVLDEAYFLGSLTHTSMTNADLLASLRGSREFSPQRNNAGLEQLIRSMRQRKRRSWRLDLDAVHQEMKARLRQQVLDALRYVLKRKSSYEVAGQSRVVDHG